MYVMTVIGVRMKLSEYLHNKMGPDNAITWRARTEDQIEEWIVEWYKIAFRKAPPMWLTTRQAMPSRFKERKE